MERLPVRGDEPKAGARGEGLPHGEAVECENLQHERFNVAEQLRAFVAAGGEIMACGTCLNSRQMGETDACPCRRWWTGVKLVSGRIGS